MPRTEIFAFKVILTMWGQEQEWNVQASGWTTQAFISGPPEDCYEADGEVHIDSVWLDDCMVPAEVWGQVEDTLIEAAWEAFPC
jgi:hypothetical protein